MFGQTHIMANNWDTNSHQKLAIADRNTHCKNSKKCQENLNCRGKNTGGCTMVLPWFFHALFSWAVSCIKTSFTFGELIPPSDLNMFALIWPKIFLSNGIIIQSRVEYDGCTHSEIHGLMYSNSNTNLNRHKYTLPWVGGWSRQFFHVLSLNYGKWHMYKWILTIHPLKNVVFHS